MKNVSKSLASMIATVTAASLTLSSCVDHDYDLTEDIDMTIQIGSNFITLPSSSVDAITLDQILDLSSSSSIKTVETNGEYGLKTGDYVLVQPGQRTDSDVKVPEVTIRDLSGSQSETKLPEFVSAGSDEIVVQASLLSNNLRISDDNVTKELVSLEQADLDVLLSLNLSFISSDFAGTAYIKKGFRAEFDPSWTVTPDATSANYIKSVSDNVIEFIADAPVTSKVPLKINIKLVKVDFTKLPATQGIYEPGKFLLDCNVLSVGDVAIKAANLPLGSTANLNLHIATEIEHAKILAVTGVVEPNITIATSSFTINDIPDFLKGDENHLDIANPMIYFTVSNSSPLSLDVNGALTSYSEGTSVGEAKIGEKYGTKAIVIPAASSKTFVVSREAVVGNFDNIVVPTLGTLLNTIPDRISFHDVTCEALPEAASFTLGHTYSYAADYEAVIPFAFGSDMFLHYTHEDTDWDEDLDKYNFNEVNIKAIAINTIPMTLTPEAVALDKNGNEISDITATVVHNVAAGSVSSPSRSEIEIILKSEAKNMGNLDGIRLIFDGTTAAQYVGENLNKGQSLRFEDIKVTIVGGITIDLND